MRVKIYKEDCTGCSLCATEMPEIFEMGKNTARVIKSKTDDDLYEDLKSVIKNCPGDAVELLNG